nr:hypothetical protein Hi04_10k_c5016_00044 [uncultured bacterium]
MFDSPYLHHSPASARGSMLVGDGGSLFRVRRRLRVELTASLDALHEFTGRLCIVQQIAVFIKGVEDFEPTIIQIDHQSSQDFDLRSVSRAAEHRRSPTCWSFDACFRSPC